ncbi:MAG: DNA-3-methyladenine glycosylase I [Selenomonadaceae bacterium]|nr:DNA-3-methyladenine glycosylase I [Selenomonadaceae bacterium]
MIEQKNRCFWCGEDELMIKYHDEEFGMPTFDDHKQFEHLSLEVLQCGLNWRYVIHKRKIFRSCLDNFDFEKISQYNESDIDRIMQFEGMLRSRRKIAALINNAKCFIKIREEFGSFSNYIWSYVDNVPLLYSSHNENNLPAKNELSERIAKDLKIRGFKYVGAVTIYSHLQGVGIINDHFKNCFRREEIISKYPPKVID